MDLTNFTDARNPDSEPPLLVKRRGVLVPARTEEDFYGGARYRLQRLAALEQRARLLTSRARVSTTRRGGSRARSTRRVRRAARPLARSPDPPAPDPSRDSSPSTWGAS
jgi:hypothetical protein